MLGPLNFFFSESQLLFNCFLRREVRKWHGNPSGDFAERSCDIQEEPTHITDCKAMTWKESKAGREKSTLVTQIFP